MSICSTDRKGKITWLLPASGARLPLYEEPEKVKYHEHDMIVEQGRVDRFWDEQHGDQPLEAVHQGTC